jgi:hypothetical protein
MTIYMIVYKAGNHMTLLHMLKVFPTPTYLHKYTQYFTNSHRSTRIQTLVGN